MPPPRPNKQLVMALVGAGVALCLVVVAGITAFVVFRSTPAKNTDAVSAAVPATTISDSPANGTAGDSTAGDDAAGDDAAGGSSPGNAGPGCSWLPTGHPARDVGVPKPPNSHGQTMTINTNLGPIVVNLDPQHAPCTVASMAYLGTRHYYDNTPCHRLVTSGIFVLQCGDPTGTGSGSPGYQFKDENLSAVADGTYRRGTVAMANSGPNTNGSQFFIVYQDTKLAPNYTPFGTVSQGLALVDRVAAAGDDGAYGAGAGGGHPKLTVTITSLSVG